MAYGDGEELEEPIGSEDFWTVITSFFGQKGLVRQQLESFNEFVENTMQEIVDERGSLILDQHAQYTGAVGDETVSVMHFDGLVRILISATTRNQVWTDLPRESHHD